jgi:dihydrofolate reductase
MTRVRVHNIAVSLDGFMAGQGQDLDNPMGVGGSTLHPWVFETATGRRMIGADGGSTGVDDAYLVRGDEGVGATIIGRNMFGPIRGPWDGDAWTGWWGPEPPYHHDVFVLTHHARDPLVMAGGTTFHFVTDGIETALARAAASAGGLDVRIGGGASTIQQFLAAGLVDELHLAIVPVLLGSGERLLAGFDPGAAGLVCVGLDASEAVAHVRLERR